MIDGLRARAFRSAALRLAWTELRARTGLCGCPAGSQGVNRAGGGQELRLPRWVGRAIGIDVHRDFCGDDGRTDGNVLRSAYGSLRVLSASAVRVDRATVMPSRSPDLETRRQRVSRIRRRVVGGAVSLFALGTGAIALQLATGHDPALAKAAADAAATSSNRSAPSTPRSSSGGDDGPPAGPGWGGGGSSSSDGASGSSASSSGQVAPLTTGQS